MSKLNKLAFGVAAIVTAAYILKLAEKHKREKILRLASNEGYETAHDVLFPKKDIRNEDLLYGPVLPKN